MDGIDLMTSAMAFSTLFQISSGSCETQPGCGNFCGNSWVDFAKIFNSLSKSRTVAPVVPWSIDIMTLVFRCMVLSFILL